MSRQAPNSSEGWGLLSMFYVAIAEEVGETPEQTGTGVDGMGLLSLRYLHRLYDISYMYHNILILRSTVQYKYGYTWITR